MKRKRMRNKRVDNAVFANTADRTRRINIFLPTIMRGGFRL